MVERRKATCLMQYFIVIYGLSGEWVENDIEFLSNGDENSD